MEAAGVCEQLARVADAGGEARDGPDQQLVRYGQHGAVLVRSLAVAVSLAAEHLRVIVEPTGAVALAALLSAAPVSPGPVGVVLSGSNTTWPLFRSLVDAPLEEIAHASLSGLLRPRTAGHA